MSWKFFCFSTFFIFVVLRVLDALLTSYGVSNFELVYELNPTIRDPSSFFSVLLSPVPLLINFAGLFSIMILFISGNFLSGLLKKHEKFGSKIISFMVEIPCVIIVLSIVALVNNLIILFLGGWSKVPVFSIMLTYSDLYPLIFTFVLCVFLYEFFIKTKLKIFYLGLLEKGF